VVDGAENDYVSFYTSGHYEVAPYYTEDNHLSPPAIVIMNQAKFLALSDKFQHAIRDAAHEAALFERNFMRESNRKAKIKMLEENVVIFTPDTAPFRAAVAPIYQEYPSYVELIRKINAIE
jgi:TRAP-type C4-dicarboxylate transport system substrate-binding protein